LADTFSIFLWWDNGRDFNEVIFNDFFYLDWYETIQTKAAFRNWYCCFNFACCNYLWFGSLANYGINNWLTPLVVVRAIILNGIGGVVFGWLFWKKGIESAIIAHFETDIFLLTLLPILVR